MPKIASNLYYPSNGNVDNLKSSTEKLNNATARLNIGEEGTLPKFLTLADLQDSGLAEQFNETVRDSKILNAYNQSGEKAKSVLNQEINALEQLNKILLQFNIDSATPSKIIQDVLKPAQTALSMIQDLLNIHDNRGLYLFGGTNNDIAPCGDLNLTNIDAQGYPIANYTTASQNIKTIAISDNKKIHTGIYAGDPIFVNAIGALNKFIAGNLDECNLYLTKAFTLIDQALVSKLTAVQDIDKAKAYNNEINFENDKKLIDVFSLDEVEAITDLNDATENVSLQMKISARLFDIFRELLRSFN